MDRFSNGVFNEINKFRENPLSVEKRLQSFLIGLSRLRPSDPFIKEIENFITDLPNIRKMPPFEINDILCESAKKQLAEFTKNPEGYKNYKTGNELLEIVPYNYIKENSILIANDGAEEAYEVLNRFLLNKLDAKLIGRKTLCDNKYTQIGIAHLLKDDEHYVICIFAHKKVEIDYKPLSKAKVLKNVDDDKKNFVDIKKYEELEKKFNEEKNKNKILNDDNVKLKDKIIKIEKELKLEKIKNIKLNNIQINIKNQLDDANNTIKELTNKLNNNDLINDKKYLELQNIIVLKNDEINKLKSKINDNSLENIQPGEKIIAIGFISVDQKIKNFILPCNENDLFVKIEGKLYNEYQEYREKETYFILNGEKIKRFKTLKENNIKNGNFIMLYLYEEL